MWPSLSPSSLLLVVCALAGTASAVVSEDGIRSIPLRTHTLAVPYLDSDMQSRWWDFGGNTIVRVDKYIRLTSDRPSQDGWIFSRVPLTATNWEIEFEFKLHGKGHLHADGFAMWLTKQRAMPGPIFGSTDEFEGLGVFFDTYKNNRPGTVFPYVMAVVGNGTKVYDKSNDGKDSELMGCSARGIRSDSINTKARLTYFQDKSLKLELQYKAEDQWELCFETNEPPTIPAVSYLGFSAETGELSDNHDIISVETKNLYDTKTRVDNTMNKPTSGKGASRDRNSKTPVKKKGSWSWFFFKIMLFGLAIGGGYVGYQTWKKNQRGHRF